MRIIREARSDLELNPDVNNVIPMDGKVWSELPSEFIYVQVTVIDGPHVTNLRLKQLLELFGQELHFNAESLEYSFNGRRITLDQWLSHRYRQPT